MALPPPHSDECLALSQEGGLSQEVGLSQEALKDTLAVR